MKKALNKMKSEMPPATINKFSGKLTANIFNMMPSSKNSEIGSKTPFFTKKTVFFNVQQKGGNKV